MKRYLLILLVGLLLGAVAPVYFLGLPRSRTLPGVLIKPPDASQDASGTVAVTIDEKFFDSLLGTVFQKLGPPQLNLSPASPANPVQPIALQSSCKDVLVLESGNRNVKTGVRFTGGKITAPIAFSGSYSILGKCTQFKGWAKASVTLSFDQTKQTVFGRLEIDEVTLDDVPSLFGPFVTTFVRKAIDEQLNAFEVLRVSQLALSLSIPASGGSVSAKVKDVRADVQEGSLRMYLTYDFDAQRDAG